MIIRRILFIAALCVAIPAAHATEFEDWLSRESSIARTKLLNNVSPAPRYPGDVVLKGAIIASPSDHDPDYYFVWTRDAALVANVILSMYERATDVAEKREYLKHVLDYAEFSLVNMKRASPAGPGEPKFHVNGEPFTGPWGRPQNDGPALRASLFMRLGQILLDAGYAQYFYQRIWPIIESDLRYVSEVWANANFDLWEEIKGDHFYTRMVQLHALQKGSEFVEPFNPGLAAWLKIQRDLLTVSIEEHFNLDEMRIIENINRVEGITKPSGLDAATILAVLHTKGLQRLAFSDEFLMNSAEAIERSFAALYPINSHRPDLGTAIGRYPEDHYYGGNPWFLTTLAFAEYYFEVGLEHLKQGREDRAREFLAKGDKFLYRVRTHMDQRNGSMSEQMRRDNGYMVSARDLTWSYAAWLTAAWSRENLTASLAVRK